MWPLGFQNGEPNPRISLSGRDQSLTFSSLLYTYSYLGMETGADTVLQQSGTSTPLFSFSSGMAETSGVEREWVN